MNNRINSLLNFLFRNIPIHIIMILTAFLPNHGITVKIRGALVRPFIKKCGKKFKLASGVILIKPDKLVIGENVYIAHNTWINAVGGIVLEDNVIISPFCVIDTSKHIFANGNVTNIGKHKPISIGKGTWIATHSVITDGIQIGDGSLICSGAIVTKDVPNNSMSAGIPAKTIKQTNI
jgi:maltose O-acetyltransferase